MAGTMKKWEMDGTGRDKLVLRETPVPTPNAGEIVVKVSAVSLNYRDKLVVNGAAGSNFQFPLTPASDMAGTVVALGDRATRFNVGERVLSTFIPEWIDGNPIGSARVPPHRTLGGFFPGVLAEYVVFPQEWLVRAPATVSNAEASTLPCAGLTAWFALVERGRIRAGDVVLIEGTGGVALFGLQIAKAYGARVIVTSGNDEKLVRARELGADYGLNRVTRDWLEPLLEITGGHGADHIFELVGGSHLAKAIQGAAVGGRIYQIGFLEGLFDATVPMAPLMFKNVSLVGIGSGHRRAMEDFVAAVDSAGIKPVIDATYPLAELSSALDHLERGPFGKVVVAVA